MQVSSSDHCERSILSTVFMCAKGQINEECLLRNLESWESLSLEDTSDLVLGRALVLMLLCDSYQLPGITLPFPIREWAEHQTTFAMLEEQKFALVRSLASLAHWMGIRAAIQPTVITSPEQRAHMQVVRQWPLWESHSLHSFHSRKGSDQCRVSLSQFWESLSLADTSDLVSRRFFGCWWRLLTASRNPVITRNHFSCSSSGQEWAEHQTTFAMLEEQKFALVQSLASLAHWMGIRAAIQSTVITSTEQRAHMQVSSSDHRERAILSTVSISQRVKSMKSVSFSMLKAEPAWVWQTPLTLCWEEL